MMPALPLFGNTLVASPPPCTSAIALGKLLARRVGPLGRFRVVRQEDRSRHLSLWSFEVVEWAEGLPPAAALHLLSTLTTPAEPGGGRAEGVCLDGPLPGSPIQAFAAMPGS